MYTATAYATACDHLLILSQYLNNAVQMMNLVLTILFTLEMLLKHVALGLLGYWSSGFNVLDGIIVVASLVDLALQYSGETVRLYMIGSGRGGGVWEGGGGKLGRCSFRVLDGLIVVANLVDLVLQDLGETLLSWWDGAMEGGGGVW